MQLYRYFLPPRLQCFPQVMNSTCEFVIFHGSINVYPIVSWSLVKVIGNQLAVAFIIITMILPVAVQQQCDVLDLGISLNRYLKFFASWLSSTVTEHWCKIVVEVCMKPGKPLTFAEILPGSTESRAENKILAFGLPGNPVSCLVCFHLFVVPAIRLITGWTHPHLPRVRACLKQSIKTDPVRTESSCHYQVGKHVGFVAKSTGHQISSRFLSMNLANALLELPPGGNLIPSGTSAVPTIISDLSGFAGTSTLPS
ncbi:hypothetical protein ACJIZ3_017711 [Penstemon smallii]|uniref:Molybdopterin biosynthesis protein CNX1 n=1 Tax=Penstemon smallii TaxID=265156 RepID=A0ABD3SWB5_9LAMI